jgi:hypothetical protein
MSTYILRTEGVEVVDQKFGDKKSRDLLPKGLYHEVFHSDYSIYIWVTDSYPKLCSK